MLKRRAAARPAPAGLSRRDFLRDSGLAGLTLAGAAVAPGTVRRAEAATPAIPSGIEWKKTICPFCSVGCSIWAEVENGVWIGQEPAFESPINQGTHCAKGAVTREVGIGERRLKYPLKKVAGEWVRVSWEQAIDEVGAKLLEIREQSGPDSVYWLGSAKFVNEQAYLTRKLAALWGTNNVDHQARICHSTTVAGVANTFGYGAMTNTFNDIRNSKSIFIIGGNPAEAHPVSMLHVLNGKENGAKLIVCDPRFTRTAAHADEFVRIRPGSDIAFLWGLLREILENGWEAREYIDQRVWGLERVEEEVAKWTPERVEHVTGIPPEQTRRVARMLAENRPGTLVWCMGLTQSTVGSSKTRAASILQLALGNIGVSGGGCNIFRGHDNVQGATDLGLSCDTLPAYYGLEEGAWKHWGRVWDLDHEWLKSRFASVELMQRPGMPVSRWFDGVLENAENIEQPHPVRAMIYWGHASNSLTRGPDVKAALEAVDLLVVIDPYPTQTAIMPDRQDGVYLLPAGTTAELAGSVTNSNRSVQWREKVIEPAFEAKTDYEITFRLATKLGLADEMFKTMEIVDNQPTPESILREINRGTWTIGYTGQSPERLKRHMQHQDKFDSVTLQGREEPVKGEYYCLPWPSWGRPELSHPGTPILYDVSKPVAEGGLPFRARWGVEWKGENLLAQDSWPAKSLIEDGYPEMTVATLDALDLAGELTPREMLVIVAVASGRFSLDLLELDEAEAARRMGEMEAAHLNGDLPLAPAEPGKNGAGSWQTAKAAATGGDGGSGDALGSWQSGATKDGDNRSRGPNRLSFPNYSERALAAIRAYLRHNPQNEPDDDLPLREKILRVNWKTDLSGGLQRVSIKHGLAPYGNGKARTFVWNFPDPVPLHREPLFTPRRDLLPEFVTYDDRRMMRLPVLYRTIQEEDFTALFPLILTSGRLVEYEGGGDETRSIPWLAEFQPQMFAEINPADAVAAGIEDRSYCWVVAPEGRIRVQAMVTPRVGAGTVFTPFHYAGLWMGESLADRYPKGMLPYVIGEACNTAQTYGYDVVTMMQESKATLCRVEPAGLEEDDL